MTSHVLHAAFLSFPRKGRTGGNTEYRAPQRNCPQTIMSSIHTFSIAGFIQVSDWKYICATIVVPALIITAWWIVAPFFSPLGQFPSPSLAGKFTPARRMLVENFLG